MSPTTAILRSLSHVARARFADLRLPSAAKAARRRDHAGISRIDPGLADVENAVLDWLAAAQDNSSTHDGGSSRHFSLVVGWGASYPETSGYIVPTLIDAGRRRDDRELLLRARRMLDWLVSIQFPDGGFQGGTMGARPLVPVTFNTGQILIGLAAGVREFGSDYESGMHRAASWLVDTMDPDGCWRRFPTPFAAPGEKVYETHVAWGLAEAARTSDDRNKAEYYAAAALRNCRWALTKQLPNGWFEQCCLDYPNAPLTHTIGYVLRGLIEVYLYTHERDILEASIRTAGALAAAVGRDGFLAGRLDRNWGNVANWACLTGSAQIAHCLLLLSEETSDQAMRATAFDLLGYVRRTVRLDGPVGIRGGVQGSFPIDGEYGRYEYLNWAAKFLLDACHAERTLRATS